MPWEQRPRDVGARELEAWAKGRIYLTVQLRRCIKSNSDKFMVDLIYSCKIFIKLSLMEYS